jgi:hypothetical protein
MLVPIFTLCTAGNLARDGSLNILGAYSNVYAPSFPTKWGTTIALRILFEMHEGDGTRLVEVKVQDEDLKTVQRIYGNISVKFLPQIKIYAADLIFPVLLEFSKAGDYSIALLVSQAEAARIPVFVDSQQTQSAPKG